MALPTISDVELLARCTEVFRTYGFEGATMSRISAATGLERGSLYHRFPGGKEEMALAVAAGVVDWFTKNIFDLLKQPGAPLKRVKVAAEQLRKFYAEGTKSCLLEILSIPSGGPELAAGLKGALQAWHKAFAEISQESGYSSAEAKRRAEDAIMRIEGSLVLSRVLSDSKSFHRALDELPRTLIQME
ncbi:MAG TPA: TetR/AcrR family transcriptional regulator [Candidatus Acidoferrum sp.]|nr:TetR/AcrR family transcriptional regulator [Candidatus Acidoferrum sp.]